MAILKSKTSSEPSPESSLTALFDDLVRSRAVLTAGIETEFLTFVQNQDLCRLKWKDSAVHCQSLMEKVVCLEQENMALKTKLKHARSQIDHEINKRRQMEQDRDYLARQVQIVREFLSDKAKNNELTNLEPLAFLYEDSPLQDADQLSPYRLAADKQNSMASLQSPDDISYDNTEDDLDLSTSGIRKRKRNVSDDTDDGSPPKTVRRAKPVHRRSRSVGNLAEGLHVVEFPAEVDVDASTNNKRRRYSTPSAPDGVATAAAVCAVTASDAAAAAVGSDEDLYDVNKRTNNNGQAGPVEERMRRCNSGGSLGKLHVFTSKTVIKPETCLPCGKKIRFGRLELKCKDCRIVVHPQCKELAAIPCIPCAVTPSGKNQTSVIADFVGNDPPLIPEIVIRCVNEVESRGLHEVGMYRLSGSQVEIKALLDRCLKGNKSFPNLGSVTDVNVVAGLLKEFLRSFEEPLVTFRAWPQFVQAADKSDPVECRNALYNIIGQLPPANRDTLAFLMLHLQRVAETPECKMPKSSLAKVFGPTIIGFSHPLLPNGIQQVANAMSETKQQQLVLDKLLSLPMDYWRKFIEVGEVAEHYQRTYNPKAATATTPVTSNHTYTVDQRIQNVRKQPSFFASPKLTD